MDGCTRIQGMQRGVGNKLCHRPLLWRAALGTLTGRSKMSLRGLADTERIVIILFFVKVHSRCQLRAVADNQLTWAETGALSVALHCNAPYCVSCRLVLIEYRRPTD